MNRVYELKQSLREYTAMLDSHAVYSNLNNLSDLRLFMETHVFAVWDFMSLLKALQKSVTCTNLPWFPSNHNGEIVRFINQMVLDEESDVSLDGSYKSHFEMYIDAMKQIGAETSFIEKIENQVLDFNRGETSYITGLELDSRILDFITFTFDLIESGQVHKIAAAFVFGRETIIPDMFFNIIRNSDFDCDHLLYYLNRHIQLDGEEHGPIGEKMIAYLCGNNKNKWNEVEIIAKESIQLRIALWDTIEDEINLNRLIEASYS